MVFLKSCFREFFEDLEYALVEKIFVIVVGHENVFPLPPRKITKKMFFPEGGGNFIVLR